MLSSIIRTSVLFFHFSSLLFSLDTKGSSWISIIYADSTSSSVSEFAYIPSLSYHYTLSSEDKIDFELSERILYNSEKSYSLTPYRAWLRYTSNNTEIRIGLQKISFGPAQILRSLSWFDTIDIRNPLSTTDGVSAFRVKNYFSDLFSAWFWLTSDKYSKLSAGGRAEITTDTGELAFTLHRDEVDEAHSIGQYPIFVDNSNTRVGFDFRVDGLAGLWMEASSIFEDQGPTHVVGTLGADYTLPYLHGMHTLFEHLYNKTSTGNDINLSSVMLSIPMGIINSAAIIATVDWFNSEVYNFFRWSSTFDNFSVNCMASLSTNEATNNLQIMLTYNH